MNIYNEIIKDKIRDMRRDYDIGNKCGRSLFSIVENLKLKNEIPLSLFRLPFDENDVSGFVGYKNNKYVIFTNTSKNLGYEIFTLAHEIYHLLENDADIREKVLIEESERYRIDSDVVADMFAAELLIPEKSLTVDFIRLKKESKTENIDFQIIIQLQQEYYVEYKAITNRLREIGLIEKKCESELNLILLNDELEILTKKLGYTNLLNQPSNEVHLPKRLLISVKENFDKGEIDFDDLSAIFSYCNMTPEDFGYNQEEKLSASVKAFLDDLSKELERD